MLNISSLTKTYPNGVRSIDNLHLELGLGMFGLLGPNGAGKSSLMRTISTLQLPDSGSIQFKDIDVLNNPMSLRKVLGYLPQEFGVYKKVSADKLLDYFALIKGVVSKKDRSQLVQHVLELTNLYEARKKHVSSYSGGMKQRFGIAQLLLNNPQLIIVDEPTAGLDPAERNRFLNVLRQIGTDNTVIFSTHIVADVRELCTDMAIMNNGSIVEHLRPTEAISALNGKLWSCAIDPAELPEFERKYTVLSSNYNDENKLVLRVHADEKPAENFEATAPNLEDRYFIALNS